MHASNGNRSSRPASIIGHLNCNKGLLNTLNFPIDKVDEIANLIHSQSLDILAITEANLHGPRSRTMRANPVNLNTINNALRIPGYKIYLSDTWVEHQTARIFCFIFLCFLLFFLTRMKLAMTLASSKGGLSQTHMPSASCEYFLFCFLSFCSCFCRFSVLFIFLCFYFLCPG